MYPHGLCVARIVTLLLATLRLLERRTCAGDCPRFVSAVLELHCTSTAGEQWIRLWSKIPEGWGEVERTDRPSLTQAPGCLHPMVQDLRCLCTIMILPSSAGDHTGLCHRGPSTHLARQTESVVGSKVRSDRAGIVLFYVSSPLVLYNCNRIYLLVAVSARAFGPLTILKRDFLLRC